MANVEGTLLAYRNACAELRRRARRRARSSAGALACPACGRRYFLPQAGRSMDDDHLQLSRCRCCASTEAIKVAL